MSSPSFGSRGWTQPVEIVVAIDEDTGATKLSVVNKSVPASVAIPKIKAVADKLGLALNDDDEVFKGLGEPERHLHLHEDRATVQHRQRI